MARFGDRRTYMYQNKDVDQQIHLGEDLASLMNSPVPAANNGIVVLAEPVGIYGNTVIIDHGLGVFSGYSHLSQIDVKVGDKVEKGAVVGKTGTTGLAGGDHLHFDVNHPGRIRRPAGVVGRPLAEGPGGGGLGQGGAGVCRGRYRAQGGQRGQRQEKGRQRQGHTQEG